MFGIFIENEQKGYVMFINGIPQFRKIQIIFGTLIFRPVWESQKIKIIEERSFFFNLRFLLKKFFVTLQPILKPCLNCVKRGRVP